MQEHYFYTLKNLTNPIMEKHQIDQYDMLLSVENHFDDNTTPWTGNVPLAADKTLLSQKIDQLQLQVISQLLATTGVTADKDAARALLEALCFTQSSAISGYAGLNNLNTLYDKCSFTKTDLLHFRDTELLGVATILYNEAGGTTVLASLANWGIATGTQTTLLNAINAFSGIMKNPTEAIGKRATATDNIAAMLPDIITVLTRRMDNDIVAIAAAQPDFVSTYNIVRAIQDSPTTTLSLQVTVLEQGTNTVLSNVQVVISPENIQRTTSIRGVCRVINLPGGIHTITAAHPGHLPKTQNFVTVNGETTELVVVMEVDVNPA